MMRGGGRLCCGLHRDSGMVTAEVAVASLALVIVLAAVLSGVQWAGHQAQVQETARAASRQLARGDDPAQVAARVSEAFPGASLQQTSSAEYTHVTVAAPVELLMGVPVTVQAEAHVLVEPR